MESRVEQRIQRMVPSHPSILSPSLFPTTNNPPPHRFYVNLQTKTSQWDPPHDPSSITPANAPPSYTGGGGGIPQYAEKGSNNPYNNPNTDSDAAYAARLQAEEDERARHDSRGAADGYYQQQQPQGQGPQPGGMMGGYPGAPGQYDQHELPPREQKSKGLGGLLSKLSGKVPGGGGSHGGGIGGFSQGHGGGYGQQQPYGGGGYPQQQGYGGGGYGGGGYGMPPKKHGGMGMAGAGALGLGGGLVGGALIGNAMVRTLRSPFTLQHSQDLL